MVRLKSGEFWCRACENVRMFGDGVADSAGEPVSSDAEARGADLVCEECGGPLADSVPASDKQKVEYMRWLRECHRKNVVGPSPGGAAGQLKVSRARVYSLVEQGVLERTDCPVEGYPTVFISQRSINARKRQIEEMRNAGKDPEAGGKPWHR